MSKLDRLLTVYQDHVGVPWPEGVAPIQRVIFLVYDKTDELRLRARYEDFALATRSAGKRWHLIDVTDAFPDWLDSKRYREAYFASPEDLDGYPTGEVTEFLAETILKIRTEVEANATEDTVVALLGVGSLFGLARASSLVEGIKDVIPGRLLVFFPGEYLPDTHSYRLLDARDGWNYLALPLTADPSAR